MNVFLNAESRVDLGGIDGQTTVQDLLDAVDAFLADHPLPCGSCKDSCCKKPWAVEVDNVAAGRMAGDGEAVGRFVRDRLALRRNHAMGIRQYVLKKDGECPFSTGDNLCVVYQKRPVICRLYVCAPRSDRYDRLREAVAATYLEALVYEQNMRGRALSAGTLAKYRRNPALGAVDYSLRLQDIVGYGRWMGWVE